MDFFFLAAHGDGHAARSAQGAHPFDVGTDPAEARPAGAGRL